MPPESASPEGGHRDMSALLWPFQRVVISARSPVQSRLGCAACGSLCSTLSLWSCRCKSRSSCSSVMPRRGTPEWQKDELLPGGRDARSYWKVQTKVPLLSFSLSRLFSTAPNCTKTHHQPNAVGERAKPWTSRELTAWATRQGEKGLPEQTPGLRPVQSKEKNETTTAKNVAWILPALPQHGAGIGTSNGGGCPTPRLSAGPWGLSKLRSELRSGVCWQMPSGLLRAREIPPDRESHRVVVFSIRAKLHLPLSPPYYSMGASDLKKKKKIKGKTLINNNQDHLQF